MSQHITRYKTENGKTFKVDDPAEKPDEKNGAPEANSGAEKNKNESVNTAK